jgi:predicted DNA-binding mobile mystery protein A
MFRTLALSQQEKALAPWRELPRQQPPGGWLRAIRNALGMTTRQLAKLAGVSQAAVADAERTEARGDITLATLRRYANAMDCDLLYALVPRRPLEDVIEERADMLAHEQVLRVRHSMALENQQTGTEHLERQVASLRRALLEGRRSRLWQ